METGFGHESWKKLVYDLQMKLSRTMLGMPAAHVGQSA